MPIRETFDLGGPKPKRWMLLARALTRAMYTAHRAAEFGVVGVHQFLLRKVRKEVVERVTDITFHINLDVIKVGLDGSTIIFFVVCISSSDLDDG